MRNKVLDDNQNLFENEYGYIIFKIVDNTCDIDFLEIDSFEKNKGKGSLLLSSFLTDIQSKNINTIYLEAFLTSSAVFSLDVLLSFYSKFGFKEYDRYEDDFLRIFMSLTFN